jgi:putative cell wall-binding protein
VPSSAQKVGRLSGADRFGTSAAVSAATFAANAPVAYIASGLSFPDALSGSPAAARAGGPVLLVGQATIPAAVQTELQRLHPAKIMVLGGADVVSDAVVGQLASYTSGSVTRVAGSDRYSTSAAISKATAATGPAAAYVVSGETFPDALSAGALAARTAGAPLLLTAQNDLPGSTATELQRLAPKSIIVVGGANAVSDAVVNALKGYTTGSVTRVSGTDRFSTSAAVAAVFPAGTASVFVASGTGFPDALSASAAAGATGAPLLLTMPDAVPDSVGAQLSRISPAHIAVVGGSDAVSNDVQAALATYVT